MNVNKILKILLHNNIAKSSIMIEDDVNIDLLYKSIINGFLYYKNKNYNLIIIYIMMLILYII